MTLLPRESANLIVKLSKDVMVSEDGLKKAAELIKEGMARSQYDIKKWKTHDLHPKTMDTAAIEWIFVVDSLNFSFWADKGKAFTVKYNGQIYTGYWSLCAVVNRALQEGYPMLSADWYSKVPFGTIQHIFRSESGIVEMPLLRERHRILQETGKCLVEKFDGSFINVLKECGNSASKLLQTIVENFPSYRDEAVIDGNKVSFYKRAQLVVADIWACFEGESFGKFHDIDSITMFADYRIPQVLVHFGVLMYSDELLRLLKKGTILKSCDRLEVEIRGCSIFVVEKIRELIGKDPSKTVDYNAILIDNYLWDYRRQHAKEVEHIPFHKVRCIYY